jgi:hypothetical protein
MGPVDYPPAWADATVADTLTRPAQRCEAAECQTATGLTRWLAYDAIRCAKHPPAAVRVVPTEMRRPS